MNMLQRCYAPPYVRTSVVFPEWIHAALRPTDVVLDAGAGAARSATRSCGGTGASGGCGCTRSGRKRFAGSSTKRASSWSRWYI